MNDRTFTAAQVKAWWAYSELSSSRWRDAYARHLPPEIVALADARTPFSSIAAEAQPLLVAAIRAVRYTPFVDGVDASPAYRITGLGRKQLLRLWVIPLFSPGQVAPARYALFYAGKPLDQGDPRALLGRLPPRPYRQDNPAVVGAFHDGGMLIEGYFRSVIFMRDAPPDARLEALCPIGLDLPESAPAHGESPS